MIGYCSQCECLAVASRCGDCCQWCSTPLEDSFATANCVEIASLTTLVVQGFVSSSCTSKLGSERGGAAQTAHPAATTRSGLQRV